VFPRVDEQNELLRSCSHSPPSRTSCQGASPIDRLRTLWKLVARLSSLPGHIPRQRSSSWHTRPSARTWHETFRWSCSVRRRRETAGFPVMAWSIGTTRPRREPVRRSRSLLARAVGGSIGTAWLRRPTQLDRWLLPRW